MSESGQTLPSRDFCGTAALPLKPDIDWRGWHGRKVPISDICCAANCTLLDHLVGGGEQCGRDFEPERPRGLEVDHQLELCGLLDRKVGWLRALKDSLNVGSSPTIQVDVIRAIRDQRAVPGRWRKSLYRRQAMVHGGIDDPLSVPVRERAGLNDERHRPTRLHRGHDIVRLGDVANPFRSKLDTK